MPSGDSQPRKRLYMPPVRRPQPLPSTTTAAVAADHRVRLLALRDRLTDELDAAPTAYTAGIARQLQAVLGELASLPDPAAEVSPVDQLAARARARRAAAGIPDPPSRLTAVTKPSSAS